MNWALQKDHIVFSASPLAERIMCFELCVVYMLSSRAKLVV